MAEKRLGVVLADVSPARLQVLRVQGWVRVEGCGLRVQGLGFRVQGHRKPQTPNTTCECEGWVVGGEFFVSYGGGGGGEIRNLILRFPIKDCKGFRV